METDDDEQNIKADIIEKTQEIEEFEVYNNYFDNRKEVLICNTHLFNQPKIKNEEREFVR